MADTLLFRGGPSESIDVSTVQKREIVIDTDTAQIVSGPSKKKTVMEDSNGDVEIGGGNISLNADGSATFGSDLTVGTKVVDGGSSKINFTRPTGTGSNVYIGYSVADMPDYAGGSENNAFAISNQSGAGTVNILVGDTGSGSNRGSFAIYNKNSASPGVNTKLFGNGDAWFARNMAIGTTGSFTSSSPAISLKASGSAEFAGRVTSEIGITANGSSTIYRATSTGNNALLTLNSDVGGTKSLAAVVRASGSAEFAGLMQVGLNPTNTSTYVQLIPDKGQITIRSNQGSSAAFSILQADGTGNTSTRINADGSATFAGTVTASNITAFKSNLAAAVTSAATLADLKTAIIDALNNHL